MFNTLRQIFLMAQAERPPRSPEAQDHVDHPRTPEAVAILALRDPFLRLPLPEEIRELRDFIGPFLEEIALDCELGGRPDWDATAAQRRSEVRDFLAALKAALP